MADNNTEKQRVQELTNKLEQGLQDLFNSDSYRNYLSTCLLYTSPSPRD